QLIRAHRLAERLLYDILGGDFESGACEFEHTVTGELVDSICILLGHPETCPHGSPIPQGQCCKESCRTAQSSVVPLVELEVGQSARVAYINCKSDQQLHKIDSLCIKPGVIATLHQKYPSYVIECEGSNIAMDEQIASNICVWREPQHFRLAGKEPLGQPDRKKNGRSISRHGANPLRERVSSVISAQSWLGRNKVLCNKRRFCMPEPAFFRQSRYSAS
ncbi:MAG: metal-dependent transcriptional regulator, partial [Planctomycetota bacterium]